MIFQKACRVFTLAFPIIALGACGPDLTADDVSQRVTTLSSGLTDRVSGSVEQLENLETLSSLTNALDTISTVFNNGPTLVRNVPGHDAYATKPAPDMEENLQLLLDILFSPQNLETATSSSATFLLTSESICEVDDAECISFLDPLEVRLEVTEVDEGLNIALQVGPDRIQPMIVELRPARVSYEVDLGALKSAATFVDSTQNTAGTDSAMDALPETLEGRVRLSLASTGPDAVEFVASILETVKIEDSVDNVSITIAVADPLLKATADGTNETGSVQFAMEALDVDVPWDWIADASAAPSESRFQATLGGIGFLLNLDQKTDTFELSNVGLGSTTTKLAKDGVPFFTADLNPSSGRAFDIDMQPTEALDSIIFDITKEFDLTLVFGFDAIAGDFASETFESWMLNETFQVLLAGVDGSATIVPVPQSDTFTGGIKVLKGSLTISSTAATAPVVANANQCIVPVLGPVGRANETHGVLKWIDVADTCE